jgi:hypothetical protein
MNDTPKRGKPAKPLDERRTQHRFTLDPKILSGYLKYCEATGTDANRLCDELLESITKGGDPFKAIEYRMDKTRLDLKILQDQLVQMENMITEKRAQHEATIKRHDNPEYKEWLGGQAKRFITDPTAKKYIREAATAGQKQFGYSRDEILKDLKAL